MRKIFFLLFIYGVVYGQDIDSCQQKINVRYESYTIYDTQVYLRSGRWKELEDSTHLYVYAYMLASSSEVELSLFEKRKIIKPLDNVYVYVVDTIAKSREVLEIKVNYRGCVIEDIIPIPANYRYLYILPAGKGNCTLLFKKYAFFYWNCTKD